MLPALPETKIIFVFVAVKRFHNYEKVWNKNRLAHENSSI